MQTFAQGAFVILFPFMHSPTLDNSVRRPRRRVASEVNAELTLLYRRVGRRVNVEILQGQRAAYGQQIVKTLARQLTELYGKGWGEKHLRHCLRIAETFPDEKIVYALCRQFSWSHLRLLMFVDDPLKPSHESRRKPSSTSCRCCARNNAPHPSCS